MADGVVPVAAVVRRDPAERRRRRLALQVVVEAVGRDEQVGDVRELQSPGLQDRLKPRKREVLGHVLVGRVGAARVRLGACCPSGPAIAYGAPQYCVPASWVGPLRVRVAEVLGVALPAHVRRVELVEERRHARRVDAAVLPAAAFGPAAESTGRSSGWLAATPTCRRCPRRRRSRGSRPGCRVRSPGRSPTRGSCRG